MSKMLEIRNQIGKAYTELDKISPEEEERMGENALRIIGDYPLYGAASNISYVEAILIALVLGYSEKELNGIQK